MAKSYGGPESTSSPPSQADEREVWATLLGLSTDNGGAGPLADMVRPMAYPEIYRLFGDEEGPGPAQEVARALFVDAVDTTTAEAIVDHLQRSTAQMAVAQLRILGGGWRASLPTRPRSDTGTGG